MVNEMETYIPERGDIEKNISIAIIFAALVTLR
ncbi:MAG: hypothetical protein PWR22_137 [Moorella sp. (in: firmicutes)]|jgi:hypothetical protein|nr:hypothetical protein [Moorella sp. (in: firmicutes)]